MAFEAKTVKNKLFCAKIFCVAINLGPRKYITCDPSIQGPKIYLFLRSIVAL